MYTLSINIPAVQRMVDSEHQTLDPLAILIAAEQELEFNGDDVTPLIDITSNVEKSS